MGRRGLARGYWASPPVKAAPSAKLNKPPWPWAFPPSQTHYVIGLGIPYPLSTPFSADRPRQLDWACPTSVTSNPGYPCLDSRGLANGRLERFGLERC
ncbi:hypothetical protein SISNIDRAFT_456481 [Sistotremastrum niveocremeum HHB9708]|uniref:Uncharacterized protein n=2 Tax=Sistotremastraceae TaxID=3402574 RepID=A0A164SJC2_9AGAM|nr:hypothetical protein SISNIDRAFT_456481 [Sistotremastrum niveocremeum HHB9708]KZT37113.1 hypothetical protein SISSUDRAFT_1048959 [Sistotremastrum suecicum HHB10207 ss-3]